MSKLNDTAALFEKKILETSYPGGDLESLYAPISYAMSAGGKRLRPALTLMAAEAFGGRQGLEMAVNPAMGLEMFHNFTLLHDDVMDKSDTRRGRPAVHAKWDVNTAILSGDTMLTLATRYISQVSPEILVPVLDIFNESALRVYEGQRLDMDFELRDEVSADEYIRMISFKTGALIAACTSIGAVAGGASRKDSSLMSEYGMQLGIAFQIQDDWLDVYGDSVSFGKPIGGDINNNKKSFLMLAALGSGRSDAEALRSAMSLPAGEGKVKIVRKIYDRIGVSELARKEIASYTSKAIAALKATSMPDDFKENFRITADKLTGRRK